MSASMDRLAAALEHHNELQERQHAREREEQHRDLTERARRAAVHRAHPPRPVGLAFLAAAVPGFVQRFDRPVPDSRWALDGDDAVVRCLCDARVTVRPAAIAECEPCSIWFLYDGSAVRAAKLDLEGSAP